MLGSKLLSMPSTRKEDDPACRDLGDNASCTGRLRRTASQAPRVADISQPISVEHMKEILMDLVNRLEISPFSVAA